MPSTVLMFLTVNNSATVPSIVKLMRADFLSALMTMTGSIATNVSILSPPLLAILPPDALVTGNVREPFPLVAGATAFTGLRFASPLSTKVITVVFD